MSTAFENFLPVLLIVTEDRFGWKQMGGQQIFVVEWRPNSLEYYYLHTTHKFDSPGRAIGSVVDFRPPKRSTERRILNSQHAIHPRRDGSRNRWCYQILFVCYATAPSSSSLHVSVSCSRGILHYDTTLLSASSYQLHSFHLWPVLIRELLEHCHFNGHPVSGI